MKRRLTEPPGRADLVTDIHKRRTSLRATLHHEEKGYDFFLKYVEYTYQCNHGCVTRGKFPFSTLNLNDLSIHPFFTLPKKMFV